jgi:hypothetical protein
MLCCKNDNKYTDSRMLVAFGDGSTGSLAIPFDSSRGRSRHMIFPPQLISFFASTPIEELDCGRSHTVALVCTDIVDEMDEKYVARAVVSDRDVHNSPSKADGRKKTRAQSSLGITGSKARMDSLTKKTTFEGTRRATGEEMKETPHHRGKRWVGGHGPLWDTPEFTKARRKLAHEMVEPVIDVEKEEHKTKTQSSLILEKFRPVFSHKDAIIQKKKASTSAVESGSLSPMASRIVLQKGVICSAYDAITKAMMRKKEKQASKLAMEKSTHSESSLVQAMRTRKPLAARLAPMSLSECSSPKVLMSVLPRYAEETTDASGITTDESFMSDAEVRISIRKDREYHADVSRILERARSHFPEASTAHSIPHASSRMTWKRPASVQETRPKARRIFTGGFHLSAKKKGSERAQDVQIPIGEDIQPISHEEPAPLDEFEQYSLENYDD